jgi:hypothetical protein
VRLIVERKRKLELELTSQALLSHPKLLVFMTHCGMHGVMEAIFHAVPMVGMPVFIDQARKQLLIPSLCLKQEQAFALWLSKA